jgi:hypothetical protein
MLPNFLGIGAQRAGTTWVYHCLREHPQIFLPDKKEIHFFSENFERGLGWYEAHFEGFDGEPVVGEITPNYLNVESALPRVVECLPDARLLVVLREPLDRARSAYRLLKKTSYEGLGFAEACQVNNYLVELSLYAVQMRRVFELFDRSRVMVVLYDDLKSRPGVFLTELFEFLAVDPTFKPRSFRDRYNQVLYPNLQSGIDRLGWTSAFETLKRSPVGRWLKRLHAARPVRIQPDGCPQIINELKAGFYKDLLALERLIDRDLSVWLQLNKTG